MAEGMTLTIVEVLADGPDGEGRILGTAETLEDAHEIGDAGNPADAWYRIYCEGTMVMETRSAGVLTWDDELQKYVPEDRPESGLRGNEASDD